MMFVGRLHSVLLLCILLPACKERAHQKGPMPQPSKAEPAGFAFDTSKAVVALKPEKTAAAASVVKEVGASSPQSVMPETRLQALKGSLPSLDDKARIMEDLRVVPQSRMARQVVCFEQGIEEATAQLLRAYRLAGWDDITVRTPSQDDSRRSFSASSAAFRLSGSAYQGAFKGCEEASGFTRVSLSFHDKLADSESDTVPQAKATPATLASPRRTLRAKRSKPDE